MFASPILFPTKSPPDSPVRFSRSIEIVLHSILACRLMIGIREASQSFGRKLESFELSEVPRGDTLGFAHQPLGGNSVDRSVRFHGTPNGMTSHV